MEGLSMKKIMSLIVAILISTSSALGAGCPTLQEFQTKNHSYPQKMQTLMMSGDVTDATLAKMDGILAEQQAFFQGIIPACSQYFKTTPNPDCSRLSVLAASYSVLDQKKQPTAKMQILSSTASVKAKCSAEYKYMMMFVK